MSDNPMQLLHGALWKQKHVTLSPLDADGNWSGLAVLHDGLFALMVNVSADRWPSTQAAYAKEAAMLGFRGELQPVAPGMDWHIQDDKRVRAQGVGFKDVTESFRASVFFSKVIEPAVEQTMRTPLAADAPIAAVAAGAPTTFANTPGKWPWLATWISGEYGNVCVLCPKDFAGITKLKALGFKWNKSARCWVSEKGNASELVIAVAAEVVGYSPRDGHAINWSEAPANWRELVGAPAPLIRPTMPSNKSPDNAPGLHLPLSQHPDPKIAEAAKAAPAAAQEPTSHPTLPGSAPIAGSGSTSGGPTAAPTSTTSTPKTSNPPVEDGPADAKAMAGMPADHVAKRGRGRPRKDGAAFGVPGGVIMPPSDLKAMSDAELEAHVAALESGVPAQDPRPKTQDPSFITISIPSHIAVNGFTLKFEPR